MRKIILFILFLSAFTFSKAQTSLQAGDVAFMSMQSGQSLQTAKDRFAFMLLKDVDSATHIFFTDNAVLNSSPVKFCKNEGFSRWKSNSSLPAGTIVSISEDSIASFGAVDGGLAFSQSGDQILALQVQGADTIMLAGISSTGWEATCATVCGGTGNSKTCLPSPLADGTNAVGFATEKNNLFFNLNPLTGTPSEILAAINNPANWTRSDSLQTWPTWSASVITSVRNTRIPSEFSILPGYQTGMIQVRNDRQEVVNMEIFTILGVPVYKKAITPGANPVSIPGASAGLYFARFQNASFGSELVRFRVY
jgi:hypothetical protein